MFSVLVFLFAIVMSDRAYAATPLFSESFTTNATTPNSFIYGGGACVTAGDASTPSSSIPACSSLGSTYGTETTDPNGTGTLRLTTNGGAQSGYVVYKYALPSSQGLDVTFDYFAYNGSGADGISFFLLDGTQPVPTTPGQSGGSLGYAGNCSGSSAGLAGGVLGIGLDSWGNYSNTGDNCHNGGVNRLVKETIAIRGSQASNYAYLNGYDVAGSPASLPFNLDNSASTTRPVGVTVRVIVTGYHLVSVLIDAHDGNGFRTIIAPTDFSVINGTQFPSEFRFGFSGSTGGSTDYHEVRNVAVTSSGPILTLAKTHASAFPAGGTGSYTLQATNSGDGPTSGTTTITDTLPAGMTYASSSGGDWACSAAGQVVTCTTSDTVNGGAAYSPLAVNVNVSAVASGTLTNSATVSGGGAPSTAGASDPTAIGAAPVLTATQATTSLNVGSQSTISTTIHNGGSAATSGTITATDPLPTGVSYVPGTASAGWTCSTSAQGSVTLLTCTSTTAIAAGGNTTLSYGVQTGAAAGTGVTNTVTVTGGGTAGSASAPATDPVSGAPVLSVSSTHTDPFTVGANGTYTLQVGNTGTGATSGTLTVTDTLPAGMTFVSASGTNWSCSDAGLTVTCTNPADAIAQGANDPDTIALVVKPTAADVPSVTNLVNATGGSAANTAGATDTTAVGTPLLTTSVTTTGLTAEQNSTYTISVGNTGTAPTSGTTTVTDTLPAGLTYVSTTGTGWACSFSAPTVTCTSTTPIATGGSANPITLTVTPTTSSSVTDTAGAYNASDPTHATSGNEATGSATATPSASTLTVTNTTTGLSDNQPSTYTLTVGNTGTTATSGTVTLTDALPATLTFDSASGTGWACTASGTPTTVTCTSTTAISTGGTSAPITLTATPNATTSITTVASAYGGGDPNHGTSGTAVSANATATPTAPTLTLAQTISGLSVNVPATIALTVGNSGNAPTSGTTTVTDTLPATMTYDGASGPGWTCSASGTPTTVTCTSTTPIAPAGSAPLTITATPTSTTPISNTADAFGGGDPLHATNATAVAATVSGTPNAAILSLTLTHTGTFATGSNGTYTVKVSNNGNAAATASASTPLVVTDQLPAGETFVSASGTNWTCGAAGQTVTCTDTTDTIAAGGTLANTIAIVVTPTQGGSLADTASVYGAGDPTHTNAATAATATDSTNVGSASLGLTLTHAGAFDIGSNGTFTMTATNAGPGSTTGTVTLTNTLPAGLTYVSATGTGWTCSFTAPALTCTSTTPIASNGSAAPVTVTVAPTATGAQVDNAAVYGGGDQTHTTAASAVTATSTVTPVSPTLSITNVHSGTAVAGKPLTYTITVANGATAPTVGPLTVTDQLPAGETFVSATGTGWTCAAASGLVTCTSSGVIAANGSAPAIALIVTPTVAGPLQNTAKVYGGGDVAHANAGSAASATDTATITGSVSITGANGASTIDKRVDGQRTVSAQGGATVAYTIAFQNGGNIAANDVTLVDAFPTGITPDPTSVVVNGAKSGFLVSASGQTLTITIPTVAAGASENVAMNGTLVAKTPLGSTSVNTASIAVNGGTPMTTLPATVLSGATNIVFNGLQGSGSPIAGATLTLLDPTTGAPVSVASGSTQSTTHAQSVQSANPFTTGSDGSFSFNVPPPSAAKTYDLTIVATGYKSRKLQLTLTPDATGQLYDVTVTALDGMPVAVSGGFALTTQAVTIQKVLDLFGNIPLIPNTPISIVKTAMPSSASIGERVDFSVTISASSGGSFGTSQIIDTLPAGLVYAPRTARLDGVALEPVVRGRVLTWTLASLNTAGQHALTYSTLVDGGAQGQQTLTNLVSIAATLPGTSQSATAQSQAMVQVRPGAFTPRVQITGRVELRSHQGVGGVRVVLEDGTTVVTDPDGRFSIPDARPGMHVVRLDTASLPSGVRAAPGEHPYDDPLSTVRLLHGVLDEQTMQDVIFIVEGSLK